MKGEAVSSWLSVHSCVFRTAAWCRPAGLRAWGLEITSVFIWACCLDVKLNYRNMWRVLIAATVTLVASLLWNCLTFTDRFHNYIKNKHSKSTVRQLRHWKDCPVILTPFADKDTTEKLHTTVTCKGVKLPNKISTKTNERIFARTYNHSMKD